MRNSKCSRAVLLCEKLQKLLEADNGAYEYYLYVPGEYSLEEAQLCQVTAKQGNQVKFNILETDLDGSDMLVPTGELMEEDCTGTLGMMGQWEYITSPAFGKNDRAFKITKPVKSVIDEQGTCGSIDEKVYPGDKGDYWTPPTPDEVEFFCGELRDKKYCDITVCPHGPIYFMQYGVTENVYEDMGDRASDSYYDDIEYQKARARGWDD